MGTYVMGPGLVRITPQDFVEVDAYACIIVYIPTVFELAIWAPEAKNWQFTLGVPQYKSAATHWEVPDVL
jgi:hypothetical protein